MMPKVVIRVDSSYEIGGGHVMRCLAIAEELRQKGVDVIFLCRDYPGSYASIIRKRLFRCMILDAKQSPKGEAPNHETYNWELDAEETISKLCLINECHLMIVDHYGLDARWEHRVAQYSRAVMVIDDLANRNHEANLLLDQTAGRKVWEYEGLVNPNCSIKCGVSYVLLRREFDQWRSTSLERKRNGIENLMISFGGSDKHQFTLRAFQVLNQLISLRNASVTILLGPSFRGEDQVHSLISQSSMKCTVSKNSNNVAQMLSSCDLVIGAAGTSAWERCYLGVPSVMVAVAENQERSAGEISASGAAIILDGGIFFERDLAENLSNIYKSKNILHKLSQKSSSFVSQNGIEMIVREIVDIL